MAVAYLIRTNHFATEQVLPCRNHPTDSKHFKRTNQYAYTCSSSVHRMYFRRDRTYSSIYKLSIIFTLRLKAMFYNIRFHNHRTPFGQSPFLEEIILSNNLPKISNLLSITNRINTTPSKAPRIPNISTPHPKPSNLSAHPSTPTPLSSRFHHINHPQVYS